VKTPTPSAVAALAAYTATVPAANLLITHFGPVPVGFGLLAPAGVYMAGIALTLRDAVHELAGWRWALAALNLGAILSYLIADPRVAVASAVAFGVSELADLAIYAPLRRRGKTLAVAVSGAVGLIIDSALFLTIAFGTLAFLPGQVVAKTWTTAATVLVVAAWRRRRVTA
jgi:hypothetical protein